MPCITIQITREKATIEQKQRLVFGVTQLMQEVLGKEPKSTFVIIEEVENENWGVGGALVSEGLKS